MVAVAGMAVIGFAAELVISKMGIDDGGNGGHQEPELQRMPALFGQQQQDAGAENQHRPDFMVMQAIAMHQGICPDDSRQQDHKVFKRNIFDDVNAKNGQGTEQ